MVYLPGGDKTGLTQIRCLQERKGEKNTSSKLTRMHSFRFYEGGGCHVPVYSTTCSSWIESEYEYVPGKDEKDSGAIWFSSSVISTTSVASCPKKSMSELILFQQEGHIWASTAGQSYLYLNPPFPVTRALWCWWGSIIAQAGGPYILCRPEGHWMGFSTGWQGEEEVARTVLE